MLRPLLKLSLILILAFGLLVGAAGFARGGAVIVYQTFGNGALWLLDFDRAKTMVLVEDTVSEWSLSPDGRWLAYRVPENTVPNVFQLVLADRSGNTVAVVDTMRSALFFAPRWSPDSRYLTFNSPREGGRLVLLDTLDGSQHILSQGFNYGVDRWWSADSTTFYFSEYLDSALKGMAFDAVKLEIRPAPAEIELETVLSPDGKVSVMVTQRGPEILLTHVEGDQRRELARYPYTARGDAFSIPLRPVWSPDGRYIAVLTRNMVMFKLEVLASETGDVLAEFAPFTHEGSAYFDPEQLLPVWSMDSQRVIFLSRVEDGAELYALEIATGQAQPVTQTEDDETPLIPGGHYALYLTTVDQYNYVPLAQLHVLDMDSMATHQVEVSPLPIYFEPDQRPVWVGDNDVLLASHPVQYPDPAIFWRVDAQTGRVQSVPIYDAGEIAGFALWP